MSKNKHTEFEETLLTPKQQVAQALAQARDMRKEASELVAEAFRTSGYKAKPQVTAVDVEALMEAGLQVELDDDNEPVANALVLIALYAKDKGLKGKKLKKYVRRSINKQSRKGFTQGCSKHKNHPEALSMKKTGHGLRPASYRDSTVNSSLNHLISQKSASRKILSRISMLEEAVSKLSTGQALNAASIEKINRQAPSTRLTDKEKGVIDKAKRDEEIVKLFTQRKTITAISLLCRCNRKTVDRVLKKAGIK